MERRGEWREKVEGCVEVLRTIKKRAGDVEADHSEADEAILKLLDEIDPRIRVEFEAIEKWYA